MRILLGCTFLAAALISLPAAAQTANTAKSRDVAYGARLTQPAPIVVNERRINARIDNRISNRLSTRIQRYTPVTDPAASLREPVGQAARRAIEQPVAQQEEDGDVRAPR